MEVPLSPGNLIIITGYVRSVSIMIISELCIGFISSLDFLDPTYCLYLMVLLCPKKGKIAMASVIFRAEFGCLFEMKKPAHIEGDAPEGSVYIHTWNSTWPH
jgi:hypothetical protein